MSSQEFKGGDGDILYAHFIIALVGWVGVQSRPYMEKGRSDPAYSLQCQG